jgi:CDP-glucose 4,6-dehydratase
MSDGLQGPSEDAVLRLDSTKSRVRLGWRPRLSLDAAIQLTVDWYRAHHAGQQSMLALSERQIAYYASSRIREAVV